MPRFRTSIRGKLLLTALVLFLIPWTGYHYVREMKQFLLQGQENALHLMARAVATVLNDRDELFFPDTGVADAAERYELYAYPLEHFIRLDGDTSDWGDLQSRASWYADTDPLACSERYDPASLSFRHVLAYRGDYLYAFFQVRDETRVYRDIRFRRLDNSDHLRVTLRNPDEEPRRYILTAAEPGRMSVYAMDPDWIYPLTGTPVYEMTADWRESDDGYVVELRLPRFQLRRGARLTFAVGDVDDKWRRNLERLVSTSPFPGTGHLQHLVYHSPEFEKIMRGIDQPGARISVIDRQRRIRARRDALDSVAKTPPEGTGWFATALDQVYRLVIRFPGTSQVREEPQLAYTALIKSAFGGETGSLRYTPDPDGPEILTVVEPIHAGGTVMGAVLIEQNSDNLLNLQYEALKNVISVTLLVFLLVALSLVVFASRLTSRIRRLHNATETAIGRDGRVRMPRLESGADARDEIGDLSRSISGMLTRLDAHNRYLEAMPDTLAHEMNNPLNVVNSSLENLKGVAGGNGADKYIERARSGISRLRTILTHLTEAASLEEALQRGEPAVFDLVELVRGALEGYRIAQPGRDFRAALPRNPLPVHGAPDHVAQMLDKLVDNALDFARPGTSVEIDLRRDGEMAALSVGNLGPPLPANNTERLFDPMVSIGKQHASQSRLGLGLYVARLIAGYHAGRLGAANREDGEGVVFTAWLPLAQQATSRRGPGDPAEAPPANSVSG
ncbi:MAG: hypothetical protein LJE84_14210 [Gammaproteobacteria bacterium]|nr:hypothetical protein [Gammaproteobacteria bacterium]